jgi:hypothetical protein
VAAAVASAIVCRLFYSKEIVMFLAVGALAGNKLRHLLGNADALSLITIVNAGSGTPSPRLSMKLAAIFGRNSAASIFTVIGTANTVQPKFLRRLKVLLGKDAADFVTAIEAT